VVVHGRKGDDEALAPARWFQHSATTETEVILIRHIAQSEWLRARALRPQADCVRDGLANEDVPKLGVLIRYQTTHERAFHRSLKDLQRLRKKRRNIEIGFEFRTITVPQQDTKTLAFLATFFGTITYRTHSKVIISYTNWAGCASLIGNGSKFDILDYLWNRLHSAHVAELSFQTMRLSAIPVDGPRVAPQRMPRYPQQEHPAQRESSLCSWVWLSFCWFGLLPFRGRSNSMKPTHQRPLRRSAEQLHCQRC